jgi:hypothetical protein
MVVAVIKILLSESKEMTYIAESDKQECDEILSLMTLVSFPLAFPSCKKTRT